MTKIKLFVILKGKYYNKSNEFKWKTVTSITNEFLDELIVSIKTVDAKQILDVETKDSTM